MKKKFLFVVFILLSIYNMAQIITDIDGNVYNEVTIGNQVWMKENLKVTHYNNNDVIPNITDSAKWVSLSTGAICYYANDSSVNAPEYGALYNWFAVNDNRKLCPVGWHVSTDHDWNVLETFLDNTIDTNYMGWLGTDIACKLKETDTTHWRALNPCSSNSSGFSAFGGGYRMDDAAFSDIKIFGFYWNSTEYDINDAWSRGLFFEDSTILVYNSPKLWGFSVRCVMDSLTTQIYENSIDKQIQIFPNPVIDMLNIKCEVKQNKTSCMPKCKMQISNLLGEVILQYNLYNETNSVDVSDLPCGLYIIKLATFDKTILKKMIKK